jgi:hypothetical protein
MQTKHTVTTNNCRLTTENRLDYQGVLYMTPLSTITVISWRSVLSVEESVVPGEYHRPAASH